VNNANQGETGIVGFLSAQQAEIVRSGNFPDEYVQFEFEPGNENVTMRVRKDDIVDLRPGSESDGYARFHVILKPGSHVETAVKMFRNVNSIEDATLPRLSAAANVSVSFV
jgi:hypothetical protein